MQRAPANFERTNGGRWRCPGLGLGLRSGSFAQGACGGGRDTLKGGPHSGIGETSWRAKAASDSLDSGRLAAPGAPFLARLAMGWPISPLWTYALGIPPRNLPIAMRLSLNARIAEQVYCYRRADRQSELCAIEGNLGSSPIYSIWFRLRHCEGNMDAWKQKHGSMETLGTKESAEDPARAGPRATDCRQVTQIVCPHAWLQN